MRPNYNESASPQNKSDKHLRIFQEISTTMRILEDMGKKILENYSIITPEGETARDKDEAESIMAKLDEEEVMLKALIPVGNRKARGGIKVARRGDDARKKTEDLLDKDIAGWNVEKILIEEKVEPKRELYASIILDEKEKGPLFIGGCLQTGGHIEKTYEKSPEAIKERPVDIRMGLERFEAREIAKSINVPKKSLNSTTEFIHSLYQIFADYNLELLEINPIFLAGEKLTPTAIDCVMKIDPFAVAKYPGLEEKAISPKMGRPPTEREKEAKKVDERDPYRGTARYTELEDGNIGFLCGGGGGSLTVFDAILRAGGEPANYTELGGNPPVRKVKGLAKIVISQPGTEGLIVCINTSSNTQADNVAEGVVRAMKELGITAEEFPVIFRLPGVHQEEAKKILNAYGIEFIGQELTMEGVAEEAVKVIKGK